MQAPPQVPQAIHDALIAAISANRTVRFRYQGKERIVEPHDYGVQNGRPRLLAFQTGGQSSSGRLPGWRWIDVAGITELEILDIAFSGNRLAPSGKHHQWDVLFIRVGKKAS